MNLEEENKKLKEENQLLKQLLNKPSAYKKYYEANKEIINKKNKEIIRLKQKEYYEKTKKEKLNLFSSIIL